MRMGICKALGKALMLPSQGGGFRGQDAMCISSVGLIAGTRQGGRLLDAVM